MASRVIPCANVAVESEIRYLVDPRDLRKVIEIEDAGDDLTAIYHSHTRSGAYPSPTDRDEARYPHSFYVLVSVRADPAEIRAYRINERQEVSEVTVVDR